MARRTSMVFARALTGVIVCLLAFPAFSGVADSPRRPRRPPPPPPSTPREWTFTRADYGKLRARGLDLHLAPDSAWLPAVYGQNLLRTLSFALDPGRTVSVAEEVSFKDFFHGHISCPKPCAERAETLARDFDRALRELHDKALGDDNYTVNAQVFAAFRAATLEGERLASRMLSQVLQERLCPDCVLIYHTFEHEMPPGMTYNDPRRNLLTPLLGATRSYTPPSLAASSFKSEYCELLQLDFLVDESGGVHTTVGTERDMKARIMNTYDGAQD